MKATCPRCGTKAAHEMVVSVVRTWFRCVDCGFVWRGTLLSLAFSTVALGSAFRDEDAAVPLDIPAVQPAPSSAAGRRVTPPTTAGADAGRRSPERPDFDLDEPVAREKAAGTPAPGVNASRSTPLEPTDPAGPSTDSGGAEPFDSGHPEPGRRMTFAQDRPAEARAEPRDVETWLSRAEADIPGKWAARAAQPNAERSSADVSSPQSAEKPAAAKELNGWLDEVEAELPVSRTESLAPGASSDAPSQSGTTRPPRPGSVEVEDWLRAEDLGTVGRGATIVTHRERAGSDRPSRARSASIPPQPAASPAVPGAVATAPQQGGSRSAGANEESAPPPGLASLHEVLKQLEHLHTGLSEMEQRLGGSEESSSNVVEKRQPSSSDSKPSDDE
jgi:hypothetical protein